MIEVDYKRFQDILNKYYPNAPLTETEAAEAFHNLADFISLLMQINNDVGLVPVKSQKNKDKN